jgi:hypothetical protein
MEVSTTAAAAANSSGTFGGKQQQQHCNSAWQQMARLQQVQARASTN